MDMAMDMVTMDIMARGLQRLSQDMVIMAMDMVLVMVMDMAMVIMDIMARDLLMLSQLLLLSLVMDMAMDMDMDIMDMVMAMDMDTMVRKKAKCCYFLEFSTPEVDHNRSSQNKHTC